MGEEGDRVKIDRLDKDVSSLETEVKSVNSRLIRMEVNVEKILATYTNIQNVSIGLLVINIAGIIWGMNK